MRRSRGDDDGWSTALRLLYPIFPCIIVSLLTVNPLSGFLKLNRVNLITKYDTYQMINWRFDCICSASDFSEHRFYDVAFRDNKLRTIEEGCSLIRIDPASLPQVLSFYWFYVVKLTYSIIHYLSCECALMRAVLK